MGLPEFDLTNARDSLDYNEAEIAYIIIVDQLFEHRIPIDQEFYDLALELSESFKIDKKRIEFLKELVDKEEHE